MIKKTDVVIAVIIIALSISGYFLTGATLVEDGKTVVIESEGKLFAQYPMTEYRVVDVKGHNKIEITPEYVRVIYADCPEQTDVKQGKISSPGSIIVCLPNKMTVRIAGETKIDAISY